MFFLGRGTQDDARSSLVLGYYREPLRGSGTAAWPQPQRGEMFVVRCHPQVHPAPSERHTEPCAWLILLKVFHGECFVSRVANQAGSEVSALACPS